MVFRIERVQRIGPQSYGRHDIRGPLRVAAANARASQAWAGAINDIAKEYEAYEERETDDQETEADLRAIKRMGDLEAANAEQDEFDASTLDPEHPRYNQGHAGDAPTMVPGYDARPEAYRLGAKKIAEEEAKGIQDPRRRKEFRARYLKTIEGNYVRKKIAGLKEAEAFHDRKLKAQIDQAESQDNYAVSAELIKRLKGEDDRIFYAERNADRAVDSRIAQVRLLEDVPSLKQLKKELTDPDYNGPLSATARRTKATAIQADIKRIEDKDEEEEVMGRSQAVFDGYLEKGLSPSQMYVEHRKVKNPKQRDNLRHRIDAYRSRHVSMKAEAQSNSYEYHLGEIDKNPDHVGYITDPNFPKDKLESTRAYQARARAGIPTVQHKQTFDMLWAMSMDNKPAFGALRLSDYNDKLDDTGKKVLRNVQNQINTGKTVTGGFTSGYSVKDQVNTKLVLKGYKMHVKAWREKKEHVEMIDGIKSVVMQRLYFEEVEKGEKLSPAEADAVINDVFEAVSPVDKTGWVGARATTRLRIGILDVPLADRQRLLGRAKRAGAPLPTPAQILEQYKTEQWAKPEAEQNPRFRQVD